MSKDRFVFSFLLISMLFISVSASASVFEEFNNELEKDIKEIMGEYRTTESEDVQESVIIEDVPTEDSYHEYSITSYEKFCWYEWDASLVSGETAITSEAKDSAGMSGKDVLKVNIEGNDALLIQEEDVPQIQNGPSVHIDQPPQSLGNRKFEIRSLASGPNEIQDMLLSISNSDSITKVYFDECIKASYGIKPIKTNAKFKLDRKHSVIVTDYKDMKITFSAVYEKNILIEVTLGENHENLEIKIGETREIFGTKISYLGLERGGHNPSRFGGRDYTAIFYVGERAEEIPAKSARITIHPEKQVTENGEAKFKILVQDLRKEGSTKVYALVFSPQNYEKIVYSKESNKEPISNSGTEEERELKKPTVVTEAISGEFSEKNFKLSPGESKSVSLTVKVKEKSSGYFYFLAKLFNENYLKEVSLTEERGLIDQVKGIAYIRDVNPELFKPKVYLNPEKQYTEDGKATYSVVIQDTHPRLEDKCKINEDGTKVCVETQDQQSYSYSLGFYSRDGETQGEFETASFQMNAGEKKIVILEAKSQNFGTNIFEVSVKNEETKAGVKGVLMYKTDYVPAANYFNGEGFALLENRDKYGFLFKLKLFNDGKILEGKMQVKNNLFRVKGEISEDSSVRLEIFENNDETPEAILIGELKDIQKTDSFQILEGKIYNQDVSEYDGELIWSVTALSKREKAFFEVNGEEAVEQAVEQTLEENEIIEIKENDVSKVLLEVEKIFKKKFLWFNYGDDQVRIKITDEGEVRVETITKGGEKIIDNYKIKVDVEEAEEIEDSLDEGVQKKNIRKVAKISLSAL